MSVLDRIRELPGIVAYRKRKYRRRFQREGRHNLFYGIYETFEDAAAAAPANRELGYDHPAAARMYRDQTEATRPAHYPALFWLSRSWSEYRCLLDFGGHRGSLYYASRRLLGPGPRWYVFDLPAVVEEGRKLAAERGATDLAFESDLAAVPEVDVVVVAGSLQYVEDDAESLLTRIGGRPRHVIVNAAPFHPRREFVTLNNMGTAYCPYKVRRQGVFFGDLQKLGFELVEEWHHPGKSCVVPFHVGEYEVVYRGAYFRRRDG